jgi:hypothetical protein
VKHTHGLTLSRWILLALVLMALGAPQRGSAQAMDGGFDDALIRSTV